ncbi:MAG: hypothetical protein HYY24_03305 [Verrucomicrobia bacterium]|nr:hypothetical protein [Verrucomicrobiota bacterium]
MPVAARASYEFAVASDGQDYLVVYQDDFAPQPRNLVARQVLAEGTLGEKRLLGAADSGALALAVGGNGYLLVWDSGPTDPFGVRLPLNLYARRLSRDGQALDPRGMELPTVRWPPIRAGRAGNAQGWLIVWQEQDREGGWIDSPPTDIHGARISAGGELLDLEPLAIATSEKAEEGPVVASDGNDFLVVWYSGSFFAGFELVDTRVTTEGAVLNPNGKALNHTISFRLTLAGQAGGYLLCGTSGDGDLSALRLRNDGEPKDAVPFPITRTPQPENRPAAAANDSGWLVAWHEAGLTDEYVEAPIRGARVGLDGVVQDVPGRRLSYVDSEQSGAVVASNGSNLLVTWFDNRHSSETPEIDLYGTRLAFDGKMLDQPEGLPLCTTSGQQSQQAVASLGGDFLIVWVDERRGEPDLRGARITGEGRLLDGDGFVICEAPGPQVEPSLAASSEGYLVVWEDSRSAPRGEDPAGHADIFAAHVTREGRVVEPNGFAVCSAPAQQSRPRVASDGKDFLVVWHDRRWSPELDVYAGRVSGTGGAVDGDGVPVARSAGWEQLPVVAGATGGYLVLWEDGPSIVRGRRIGSDGTMGLMLTAGPLGQGQSGLVVAGNGQQWLAAWLGKQWAGAFHWGLVGSLLDPAGVPLTAEPVSLSSANPSSALVSVAAAGDSWFVAWDHLDAKGRRRVAGNFISFRPRARLAGVRREPDGSVSLELQGYPGAVHALEASVNLTDWSVVGVLTNETIVAEFLDRGASGFGHRFYRARLLP